MDGEPKVTGKKLEGLVMEENKDDQASVIMRTKMAATAREVWSKVKSFVVGKVVRKVDESGALEVYEAGKELEAGTVEVNLEEVGKELEDGMVELVEEEVSGLDDDARSVGSGSLTGSKTGGGFEFLECLEKEDREEVLEKKLEESRKRKWQSDGMVKQKGLLNMTGWLKRETEVRGDKRWKRTVVRGVVRENGGGGAGKE